MVTGFDARLGRHPQALQASLATRQGGERVLRAGQQHLCGLGGHQALALQLEQAHAQGFAELAQVAGQGGLRHAQGLGSTGGAAQPHHGLEGRQLRQHAVAQVAAKFATQVGPQAIAVVFHCHSSK